MDDWTFDSFACRTIAVLDRRAALGILGGSLATALAPWLEAEANKKKGKKKKKKDKCKGKRLSAAQACNDNCGSDADRQHGKEQAANCRSLYRNTCDFLAEADECTQTLTKCCNHFESCDQGSVATCRDAGYQEYPELCDFIYLPICGSL